MATVMGIVTKTAFNMNFVDKKVFLLLIM